MSTGREIGKMKVSYRSLGDTGSFPGSGRSLGDPGHGNPLQYSCLGNLMDRGAWWATVHRVANGWPLLKRLNMHTYGSPGLVDGGIG